MAETENFSQEVLDAVPSIDAVEPGLRAQCRLAALDDVSTLVFARQLETISRRVVTIQYPELKASRLIPTNTEAGPADEYLTFRVWDAAVMAKTIGWGSTDIPTVNATARELTTKFFTVGDGFTVTQDDMRSANRAGLALVERYMAAARRGIELAREEVAAVGSPEIGTYGLANHPNVPVKTLPNGDWANAATTGEEIVADLNYLVNQMALDTNEILQVTDILMPVAQYQIASSKLINVGGIVGGMTALQLFKQMNPSVNVESWNKLGTAGADGGARIVAYKRSSDVLEFLSAVEFESMPVEYRQWQWYHTFRARFGGVAVYMPAGLSYADNAD